MTKFDDVGWHLDAALEAGKPEENAGVHIGLYLAWAIRRDMANRANFLAEDLDQLTAGTLSGTDLLETIDNKLTSDDFNREGTAFTDWYYARYLDDYGLAFGSVADYAVHDDASSTLVIEPILDGRYREWVDAGRPAPNPSAVPDVPLGPISVAMPDLDQIDPQLAARYREQIESVAKEMGWNIVQLQPPPSPHDAPELEQLVPAEFASQMRMESRAGLFLLPPRLKADLKEWGIDQKATAMANGIGGSGQQTVTLTIWSIPGIDAARLFAVMPKVVRQPGAQCALRKAGNTEVYWCSRPEFASAGWARDGLIFYGSCPTAAVLENLISATLAQ